ncbi:MAG: hypothetical protein C5B50_00685 [Verrucomicrobia bacterium]|nr:MAG: hypothetical protein C5B50_00685 [Verrucomicrobiota bacterium]
MLTTDEMIVLSIASNDVPMMPIGHWKEVCESLVKKGLLLGKKSPQDPEGSHNLYITLAGRKALREKTDEPYRRMLQTAGKVQQAQRKCIENSGKVVELLVEMAKLTGEVMGDSHEVALDRWLGSIKSAALKRLRDDDQGISVSRTTGGQLQAPDGS